MIMQGNSKDYEVLIKYDTLKEREGERERERERERFINSDIVYNKNSLFTIYSI